MAITARHSSQSKNPVITRAPLATPVDIAPLDKIRHELTEQLQTTLEPERMIALFFNTLEKLQLCHSLSFNHRTQLLSHQEGQEQRHQCHYELKINNEYLGDLSISRKQRFKEAELEIVEGLTGQLAYPLRNALLYRDALHSAMTDPLTNAGNRAALDKSLQREFQRATRYQEDFSILMIDIDHFKNVNDTFGHTIGDKVLCTVAQVLLRNIRDTDQAFRYGGEEFCVMLPRTPNAGAMHIAERLRELVEGTSYFHDNKEVPITVSIGCSTLTMNDDMSSLMKRSDDALYRSKNTGRNKTSNGNQH